MYFQFARCTAFGQDGKSKIPQAWNSTYKILFDGTKLAFFVYISYKFSLESFALFQVLSCINY